MVGARAGLVLLFLPIQAECGASPHPSRLFFEIACPGSLVCTCLLDGF